MAAPRYRAWRFWYPELDVPPAFAGLGISSQGHIEMVKENESVRQAILLLLSTTPGERVMRPGYGCHLHRILFYPNDDTTAGLAIHYVRRALEQWEPRIEIMHLDAQRNPDDDARLDILLDYRVKATQRLDSFALSINLAGE